VNTLSSKIHFRKFTKIYGF